MENDLLTISEFAKFSSIPRKTLIFYDQHDVLKPIERADNGYRYYNKNQIYVVSSIKLLQALNYSLTDIKEMMNQSAKWDYSKIISDQLKEIAHQKEQLNQMEKLLLQQKSAFEKPLPLLDTAFLSQEQVPSVDELDHSYKLKNVRLSEAFHIILNEYHTLPYFFDNGSALIHQNEQKEWVLSFFRSNKEKQARNCAVFYTNNLKETISYPSKSIDEIIQDLSMTLRVSLTNEIYVEINFTDFIPTNRDRLLLKFYLPIST